MRITNMMSANNLVQHIQENQEQVYKIQEQIASEKSFETPSEDPLNASASMKLKSALLISQGYQNTASTVNEWMSATDSSMDQLETLANNAINLVLSGLDDGTSSTERSTSMATELTEIINQAIDLGNTKYKDSYIFSGTNLNDQPFALDENGALTYNGNSSTMVRGVGQSSNVVMNVAGDSSISPLIKAMIDARDKLKLDDVDGLSVSLETLQNAFTSLSNDRTASGARARQVTNSIAAMKETDTTLNSLLNSKENTDLADAAVVLKAKQTALQSVLDVGSRALSALNLFDYLQQ
jgi:flagellar hook-associated protein 3 FlgL